MVLKTFPTTFLTLRVSCKKKPLQKKKTIYLYAYTKNIYKRLLSKRSLFIQYFVKESLRHYLLIISKWVLVHKRKNQTYLTLDGAYDNRGAFYCRLFASK